MPALFREAIALEYKLKTLSLNCYIRSILLKFFSGKNHSLSSIRILNMIHFIFKFICCNIVLIASTFFTSGCDKKGLMNTIPSPADTASFSNRYLALGDSYTIGQNVQANERFPYLTASLLRQQNINVQDPDYIATTGWTTIDLQAAINAKRPMGTFDIVTLLIGVNDQYQRLDTAGYRKRFTQLLHQAIQLADNRTSRVFVLSIPDYSVTPFVDPSIKKKVSERIAQFNAINKQITLENGIAYIDITPLTKKVANDPTLLTDDELHYSAKEHQKWAEMLAPLVKQVLQ
jgi:lysophospholipase L1-like esterase